MTCRLEDQADRYRTEIADLEIRVTPVSPWEPDTEEPA